MPKETFSFPYFTHRGKWEHVSKHPASLATQDAAKESHCFLTLSRMLRCVMQLGAKEQLGEQQIGLLRALKDVDSIMSLPMSLWGCLVCRSLKWLMGNPSSPSPHSCISTLWPAPCMLSQRWWEQAFADGYSTCTENWPNTGPGRNHKLEDSAQN